jgi:hypothetical protein
MEMNYMKRETKENGNKQTSTKLSQDQIQW